VLVTSGRTRMVCPICNLPGHACDPKSQACGEPIDDPFHALGAAAVTEPEQLKTYEYEWAGGTYTAQLNEKDAKRLNAKPAGQGSADGEAGTQEAGTQQPTTKARTAKNKTETTGE
jgi:hypothetical protein